MYTKKIWEKDPITGETNGRLVFVPDKHPNEFRGGWVSNSQEALKTIAKMNLSGEAHRVLLLMSSQIDFENWINISQKDLADCIGMKKENFSRALKKLVENDIVLKGPKVGRNCTYRLNPSVGWKGKAKSHKYAIKEAYHRGFKVFEGVEGTLEKEHADEFMREMNVNEDPRNHPILKEIEENARKHKAAQITLEEAIEAKKNLDKE